MDSTKELQDAIAELLDAVISGDHDTHTNPYYLPSVQKGLKALGRSAGYSTFGNDWMDALDKFKQGEKP